MRGRAVLQTTLAVAVGVLATASVPVSAGPPPAKAPAATPTASADWEKALADRIDAALAEEFLAKGQVSVAVVDLATGKALYGQNADRPLNPASNVKLMTTAAALALLGPEHRYATTLEAKEVVDGVVKGNLYLRGGGDPALVTGNLYEMAARLKASGITKIEGGVVVDGSRFSGDGLPPGFDQKNEFASYRAPIGAASINFNTYEVRVRPGKAGAPPHAAVNPPVKSIELQVEAKTVAGRRNKLVVAVDDKDGTTVVTLKGEVGADAGVSAYRYPVKDPSKYAGETLAVMLKQVGIKLGRRKVVSGGVRHGSRVLVTHRSDTLSVLVRSVNKLSNNFMAETILRTLDEKDGAEVTPGLDRVRAWAEGAGIPTQGLRYGNGSGLYDNNRISAGQIVAVLAHMYGDFRVRGDYLASLAVMGVDGTTRRRLKDSDARGWIKVKTGTLDGVSALSGYAGKEGRDPVAFSILVNGIGKWDTNKARKVQDRVAEAIVELVPAP